MNYPDYRPRRMRRTENLRRMIRETRLAPEDFIYPLFVVPGSGVAKPISSLPGQFNFSVDKAVEAAQQAADLGIPAVILFGVPEKKDSVGSEAWKESGIVQKAIRAIKKARPELVVMADACFCEYTDHGHCGVIVDHNGTKEVDNDQTLPLLMKQAISFAAAGADFVAPSDMMDGRIGAIRTALDAAGRTDVQIMAYAAKYASAFYGPFRDAVGSAKTLSGDKRTYQMDPGNTDEALREVELDIAEGADMVMVKPGLPYLDVVQRVKETFGMPTFAYQVSGEYAMIKAAAQHGWLDGERAMLESLIAFKRAGADGVLTYFAPRVAEKLAKS